MRYSILEHVGHGETHWDLLLEVEGQERLRTLRLARWPLEIGGSCASGELDPHRRVYLEYEGPISGDRGSVTRVDAGDYDETDEGVLLRSTGGESFNLVIHDNAVERLA
jgi:hypothetical protein